MEPFILPPIALQSVYRNQQQTAIAAPPIGGHQFEQQQRSLAYFEPAYIAAHGGDSTAAKLDLDRLPPGWEIGLTGDGVRYYIDREGIFN